MEENVDVKALRAKFHAQLEASGSGGGVSGVRPHEPLTNGVLRNKPSAVPPRAIVPLNSSSEPKMLHSGPQGVFPRPPPAHRSGAQDGPRPGPVEGSSPSRVRLTGELLQSKILRQQSDMKVCSPSAVRPPLPGQRSVSEVVPLRKPLPHVGPRPAKPKRPPSVNLEHFRKKAPLVLPKRPTEPQCLKGPARPPNKPWTPSLAEEDVQETYDDISALPPPPPPPPPPKPRDSWTDGYPSQHEDSDQDIYEDPDLPVPAERRVFKEIKKVELDKKELKEKQKRENEYRKKFKLDGPIEAIHTARVREDWQGGKSDLMVRQGESVEIIRVNNNPEGKWLARNLRGSVGYISNSCVDVDYEEVKRKIRGQAAPSADPECYDDIGSSGAHDSSFHSDDVYDDVDQEFPPPPPEISHDPKMAKLREKEFRKKFKFEGPIRVLYSMMVDPNASLKKAGSKELPLVRGEILEVIQETSKKRVLCRNSEGKYGYVPLIHLLHEENDVYDDIDTASDIYDNDDS
ncbi:FYN-binding protein 1 isoform X1 [Pimephales promelas]|uniref:FYN-binding protein 1 isoform X1 n=1 Tax=Pimephales promelas TaxID=90988 RepID=UPI001955C2DF|nr:FYN-binding protein 1 isoform X1 [Pimephales promelas]XP_039512256.1 FYN-binding protein 1 isoform X1 [Pimephales promelas]